MYGTIACIMMSGHDRQLMDARLPGVQGVPGGVQGGLQSGQGGLSRGQGTSTFWQTIGEAAWETAWEAGGSGWA